jgi:hypothetical protein
MHRRPCGVKGKVSAPRSLLAGLGAGMTEAVVAVTPSETIKYAPPSYSPFATPSCPASPPFSIMSPATDLGHSMYAQNETNRRCETTSTALPRPPARHGEHRPRRGSTRDLPRAISRRTSDHHILQFRSHSFIHVRIDARYATRPMRRVTYCR